MSLDLLMWVYQGVTLGRIFESLSMVLRLSFPSTTPTGHGPTRGCTVSLGSGVKVALSTTTVDT